MIDVDYNEYKETLAENMKLIKENHDLKERLGIYESDSDTVIMSKEKWEETKQEIERLNNIINKKEQFLGDNIKRLEREVVKRDNIINELEHDFESYELEYLQDTYQGSLADFIEKELERIQELKGSDKE